MGTGRHGGSSAGWFTGFAEEGEPLDLPPLTPHVQRQMGELLMSRRFHDWSDAMMRVGNCAHPVQLRGVSARIDKTSGEVLSSYDSALEPLGVTYVRCGNRRASECLSCSRLYAADTFHLIRAGVCGGKTVPESVAENPLVFATVTAPSFGRVHGQGCGVPTAQTSICGHGRPRRCSVIHAPEADDLGQPLCADCYDYASHVVWQWWAPELWRRLRTVLHRLLAKELGIAEKRLPEVATVQYAKVAEYQRRGVIHFHALIRLDGPRSVDGFAPAPARIDAQRLARLVREAVEITQLTVPGVDADDPTRRLVFGRQLDARAVRTGSRTDDPTQPLRPDQVAGYFAKYATKSANDSGPGNSPHRRRICRAAIDLGARASVADVRSGGVRSPYVLLGKWVHMLGFRGHFSSKSRRFSITLGALRRARRRAQTLIADARSSCRPLDLAALEADLLADDDSETTLVIRRWHYIGSGWSSDAERTLAMAAAARAREYAQRKAEQRSCTAVGN